MIGRGACSQDVMNGPGMTEDCEHASSCGGSQTSMAAAAARADSGNFPIEILLLSRQVRDGRQS